MDPQIIFSDGSSWVTYQANYLIREEADGFLNWMLTSAPWETETIRSYGRDIEVRRKSCAFGTGTYRYSGVEKVARPWPKALEALRYFNETLGKMRGFNFCLANLYEDGSVGLGAHADDEPEIVPCSPIMGLSLGAPRDFVVSGPSGRHVVTLQHGSAITMWGETQLHYRHSVPVRKRISEPRVSLTFRQMVQR